MAALSFFTYPGKTFRLLNRLSNGEGGRDIVGKLKQLGFDHSQAVAVSKFVKKLSSPFEAWRRASYKPVYTGQQIDKTKAWLKVPPGFLVGTEETAKHCAALYEAKKESVLAAMRPPYGYVVGYRGKGVDVEIEDPEEIRPIIQFCLQQRLFDLVADYIGEAPVLSNINLVYTQPNSAGVGPQHFHRDANEHRQIHMVIPVWPVDHESGPFTFLPADQSAPIIKALDHQSRKRGERISDEEIFRYCKPSDLIECTGEPGDLYLLNPCQCIHFGARTKSMPRLLLIVNFTSKFEGAEGQRAIYRTKNRSLLHDGTERSRLLLNL